MHVATGPETLSGGTPENSLYLSEGIHEIMEIVPTVPKLDRLRGALRGSEYGEEEWDNDMPEEELFDQVWKPHNQPDPSLATFRSSADIRGQSWLISFKRATWSSQKPSKTTIF